MKCEKLGYGKEYINKTMQKYFKAEGIIQQWTMSNTPQQNGKAERLNRTILNKMRTILFDAARYASYLYNRMPHGFLNGKSPFEATNNTTCDVVLALPLCSCSLSCFSMCIMPF